jgi:tmRNA-binding protein
LGDAIENTIYVALSQLIQDYSVMDRFQKDSTTGHRVLSNLRQLMELLQEKEQNDSLTPNELYVYLNKQSKSKCKRIIYNLQT